MRRGRECEGEREGGRVREREEERKGVSVGEESVKQGRSMYEKEGVRERQEDRI